MTSSLDRLRRWPRLADRFRDRLGRGRRIAFVLSGGGNLGAVQVGMLRALTEAEIKPDLIFGCSVGAINGAGFAAEPNLAGVERLDRLWRRIAAGDPDLMPSKFIPVVAQMARKGEALHDQERLADLLDDELPTKTFAGLEVPFACVATDVGTASEYWFDHGRLVPALLASAALPAVYPAFDHRGRTFIDGGVLNEIHTAQAVAMGATDLYLLHVGHLEDRANDVQRPFDSALRAYWTARRFRLAEDLRRIPPHCVVHRLPAGSNPRLRFDDFSQGPELADLAYDATAEYLRTGHTPEPVSGPVSAPEELRPPTEGEIDVSASDLDRSDDPGPADGNGSRSGDDGDGHPGDEPDLPDRSGSAGGPSSGDRDGGGDNASRTGDQGSDRFSRAFSRWGSSSAGQSERPPGWDDRDQG
ncbi:MAG: patatin-like phospholipase family protein [Acidimicrobiales bacterium]